ncbi:MAG: thioredoxin family protein [Pirellulaceae bacterium]|nr:thioredoxin family protein [Pirellulaceae bacterium]
MKYSQHFFCLASFVLLLTAATTGWTQSDIALPGLPSLSDRMRALPSSQPKVTFEASYQLDESGPNGHIQLTAKIAPKHHIYSTTQAAGGPKPTKITLLSDNTELAGPFVSDHQPTVSRSPYFEVDIQEFHDSVQWTAPLRVSSATGSRPVDLELEVSGQVCLADGNCQPFSQRISATFAGYQTSAPVSYELRLPNTHAQWTATIQPARLSPGQSATLTIQAATDPGYHVYKFQPGDTDTNNRTLIVASQKAGLLFGAPLSQQKVISLDLGLDRPFEYYDGQVTWTIPIGVPLSAELGQRKIELLVGFNTCDDKSCDPPAGLRITGSIDVTDQASGQQQQLALSAATWDEVARHPNLANWIDQSATKLTIAQRLGGSGLQLWMIGAALLGGFILNFMPCVLPVVGLKLMGFVNQSGNSHARVISLNLSFVAGILSVMFLLAILNIAAKLAGHAFGWGEQFTNIYFQVGLTILLFAMALSFLGVWEIPIPGFATSSKSGQLMQKEGLSGAFYKGVLTTVLATPCSGPFLGTLFGLTLTLSGWSIVALFMLVGIGLGSPYLALCLWPDFVKLLPKPGAWMETLKEVLAFPLLLSVVYFISVIDPDYRIATLGLLMVVWFACWLIGRIPAFAERKQIFTGWLSGLAACVLAGFVSFNYFGPAKHHLPWMEYSESALAENRAAGKVVMVEFTARWCLTCQYNMRAAIDRPAVAELVKQNNVVTLLADWSSPSPAIESKLRELDSNSIPLLAIYPADPAAEPIILRDVITQSQLLDALQQAGPSQSATHLTAKSQFD